MDLFNRVHRFNPAQQNKMTSTIKTAVRLRPLLPAEIAQHHANSKLTLNTHKNEITLHDAHHKNFRCDFLLPENTTQEEVFNRCGVADMVEKALQGYHSTIFAYGQTGSGKSHTMHGTQTPDNAGLTSRVVHCLFHKIRARQPTCKYTVSVSFIQIYSERIYDLLNPASLSNRTLNLSQGVEGLRLRWNKDEQFTVENMFVFECRDENELDKYLTQGLKNRISSSHKLNLQSSRSHSILSIKIEGNDGHTIRNSRIELVDLAGSERIGMTGTEGRLAKQSIDINKSLFTLRQVINVLSQSSSKRKDEKLYVPYRDSKLTSILKQSIGGNSYSLMIACLTPNDAFLQENLSTLTYTTRASFITNNPVPNLDQHSKAIQELRNQLTQVNSELSKANEHIQFLTSLVENTPKESKPSPRKKSIENQEEGDLPQPVFKKRLTERINANFDSNISERLIESINMVRELLKSNKELREKLELTAVTIEDKNNEIYDLTRQNQILREGRDTINPFEQEFKEVKQVKENKEISHHRKPEIKPNTGDTRRHPLRIPAPIQRNNQDHIQQPPTKRQGMPTGISLDMGKIFMNQKGVDSAPTNFNKRATNTSQDRRAGYSRGSVDEQDRHAITAKFSKRGWLSKDGDVKKFLSFYEDLREAQAYDFNK